MSMSQVAPTAQVLCMEAAPPPSWPGCSALVLRVPSDHHPAVGFLPQSIAHGQSIPFPTHGHTCYNSSQTWIREGEAPVGTIYIQGNIDPGVPPRGCGAKTGLLGTGGAQNYLYQRMIRGWLGKFRGGGGRGRGRPFLLTNISHVAPGSNLLQRKEAARMCS